MRKFLTTLAAIALLTGCAQKNVTLQPSDLKIVLSDKAPAPLRLAVETLCGDFVKVTGQNPEIVNSLEEAGNGPVVVVLDREESILGLPEDSLKPLDGFESHRVWTDAAKKRVYLDGKDMRGAIYAVYTFDEEFLGVPPLWFWCSWVPDHKDKILVPADTDIFFKSPQVRYRAWLPNDTDLYDPWTRLSQENAEIVHETMLRLKLNTYENGGISFDHDISKGMKMNAKYGIITTSHHMIMLNMSFGGWNRYWTEVRGMKKAPELLLSNIDRLREFWEYGVKTVVDSGVENIWNIALRGSGDQPMWILFKDAPKTEAERGKVITRLLQEQVDIVKKYTGEENPVVRMTFYDEMADLVNNGLVSPPSHGNMIWTFCSGRRDHYPYDDIQNFAPEHPVHLGYYMNLQFTSTGSHLAPGEGPWKMEFNYRYVNSKSPLYLSVLNSGNFREFMYTMTANAKMLWDYDAYDTDTWNRQFAAQYFGEEHADEVAQLYHDYFYSFWTQRKSDFPGGMDRQFIFQDHRHARAIGYIGEDFFHYNDKPLPDYYMYERVKGRVFRIVPEDNGVSTQVDAILVGMEGAAKRFGDVAARAQALMPQLDESRRTFFYDNLLGYALYMEHLSKTLYHYTFAYKHQDDHAALVENLETALAEMQQARSALLANQHAPFETWYEPDRLFGMQTVMDTISKTLEEAKKH